MASDTTCRSEKLFVATESVFLILSCPVSSSQHSSICIRNSSTFLKVIFINDDYHKVIYKNEQKQKIQILLPSKTGNYQMHCLPPDFPFLHLFLEG